MSKRAKKPGTSLTLPERAKQAIDVQRTEQELKLLANQFVDILEITNPDGREQVHRCRMVLKNQRLEIQRVAKEARDDAQKFCKAVIAEEKRLVGIIEPEELRLGQLQDRWDAEREREKQDAIEAEERRVAGIRARIDQIRDLVGASINASSAVLRSAIEELTDTPVTEDSFGEFLDQAEGAKLETLTTLNGMVEIAKLREAEQEQARKDREELERLRKEKAEREAAEQREREAAERRDAADSVVAEMIAPALGPAPPHIVTTPKERIKPPDVEMLQVLAAYYSVSHGTIVRWLLAVDFSELEDAAA